LQAAELVYRVGQCLQRVPYLSLIWRRLLEPDERLAMCLLWHGEREVVGISEDPSRIEVAWDGEYELLGGFFHVETDNSKIGERAIAGYPLDAVRKALDSAQSTVTKMASVMANTTRSISTTRWWRTWSERAGAKRKS